MILYRNRGIYHVLNLFSLDGSVFQHIFLPSLVCASIAWLMHHFSAEWDTMIMRESSGWQGFNFLVGFMIVFRTSMAYAKFWEGCTMLYKMRAEWMDACSSLLSFTKFATQPGEEKVVRFRHLLVRLFSMLHALALAEIEDSSSDALEDVTAFRYDLIDPESIDSQSLEVIRHSEGKVDLVFHWIQQLVVENMQNPATGESGALRVPPPILSRAFQELSNGMLCFQEAIKVSSVPFPFPYAQTCDCLLVIHWLITPVVTCQWFSSPWYAGAFSFIIVFIFWVLNSISVEIENPFGADPNDIDCEAFHKEMNLALLQLLSPEVMRTPMLVSDDVDFHDLFTTKRRSFKHVWAEEPIRHMRAAPPRSGSTLGGRLALPRRASCTSLQPGWLSEKGSVSFESQEPKGPKRASGGRWCSMDSSAAAWQPTSIAEGAMGEEFSESDASEPAAAPAVQVSCLRPVSTEASCLRPVDAEPPGVAKRVKIKSGGTSGQGASNRELACRSPEVRGAEDGLRPLPSLSASEWSDSQWHMGISQEEPACESPRNAQSAL